MVNLTQNLSEESLVAVLQAWRLENPVRQSQGRFPDKIKQAALDLTKLTSKKFVAKQFNIAESTLDKWMQVNDVALGQTDLWQEFIKTLEKSGQLPVNNTDKIPIFLEHNEVALTSVVSFTQLKSLVLEAMSLEQMN